jgi:hypothetical protein
MKILDCYLRNKNPEHTINTHRIHNLPQERLYTLYSKQTPQITRTIYLGNGYSYRTNQHHTCAMMLFVYKDSLE